VRAFIEGNYITCGGMDDVVEVYGADGVIKVDLSFGSPIRTYSRKGFGYAIEKADTTTGWTRPAVDEFASLGYCAEIAAFVADRGFASLKTGIRRVAARNFPLPMAPKLENAVLPQTEWIVDAVRAAVEGDAA
jgi:hypothetical protein